jgi:hypothetical protein
MDNTLHQDEMDKMNIDQLHKAVLHFSNNCFEIKKFCTTILISATTLIATFTKEQLTPTMFAAGVFIIAFFWGLDAQNYYYQELLRARMKMLANNITKRHSPIIEVDGVGMPLDDSRAKRQIEQRVLASLFNSSMFYYFGLAVFICVVWFIVYKIYSLLLVFVISVVCILCWYSYTTSKNR